MRITPSFLEISPFGYSPRIFVPTSQDTAALEEATLDLADQAALVEDIFRIMEVAQNGRQQFEFGNFLLEKLEQHEIVLFGPELDQTARLFRSSIIGKPIQIGDRRYYREDDRVLRQVISVLTQLRERLLKDALYQLDPALEKMQGLVTPAAPYRSQDGKLTISCYEFGMGERRSSKFIIKDEHHTPAIEAEYYPHRREGRGQLLFRNIRNTEYPVQEALRLYQTLSNDAEFKL